jgi:hypothetical protein
MHFDDFPIPIKGCSGQRRRRFFCRSNFFRLLEALYAFGKQFGMLTKLLVLLVLIVVVGIDAFSFTFGQRLKCNDANEFCDVSSEVGLDQLAGSLHAFGDFNSDKL